jgi:hypothetical protein
MKLFNFGSSQTNDDDNQNNMEPLTAEEVYQYSIEGHPDQPNWNELQDDILRECFEDTAQAVNQRIGQIKRGSR